MAKIMRLTDCHQLFDFGQGTCIINPFLFPPFQQCQQISEVCVCKRERKTEMVVGGKGETGA